MIHESIDDFLMHYGVKGQKWGVRRSPEELGYRNRHHSKTDRLGDRERTVFISGSSKTQNRKSEYYLKELPESLKNRIRKEMETGSRILVGDAPGIDTQVQKFLAKSGYKKVDIYSSDPEARMNADVDGKLGWHVKLVDSSRYEEGSKDARATKDKAMSTRATAAIAVVIPDGSSATRNNINRMLDNGKEVNVFQLGDEDFMDIEDYKKNLQHSELYLIHHGIKGQQWGVKNGPPYPLNGEYGNKKLYSKLLIGDFDDSKIKPGDTLDDIVNKIDLDYIKTSNKNVKIKDIQRR